MFATFLAAVLTLTAPLASSSSCIAPTNGTGAVLTSPTPAEAEPLEAAAAWLKLYRKGKIAIYSSEILNRVPLVVDWRQVEITGKQSFAIKYGLARSLYDQTWLGDLEVIAEALSKQDSAEAAQFLLEIAAVGLGKEEYVRAQAPETVRSVGEKWARELKSPAARTLVKTAAAGELRTKAKLATPIRCAALRCLGSFGDPQYRPAIESALGHDEAKVRFHAAEALGRLGSEEAAPALTSALDRETSEIVIPALADALRSAYRRYLPELATDDGEEKKAGGDGEEEAPAAKKRPPLPESAILAARAAITAIGRSTWRADMALLRFLDDFRTKDAIPALIGILERFEEHPDQVQSGKLSTLVLHRAHELLVSMTSAVFPADQPAKWRELWDRVQDELAVQERRAPKEKGYTVASGFAGIPVLGSRVLFVLDISGSMNLPMSRQRKTTRSPGSPDETRPRSRIDFARRELYRAIDGLQETQSFNLITFNGDEKAEKWNKSMVAAKDRNRERLRKYVDRMKADGGTNLWGALELALKTRSLVYGDRYETNIDEIFILSDGAPTVGEVLDPLRILSLVKEGNRFAKMRINTVFISSKVPGEQRQRAPNMSIEPEELMRRLAEENGGKCVIL